MRELSRKHVRGALVATALGATLVAGFAGAAGAEQARGGGSDGPATVRAQIKDGRLDFFGAREVTEDARLRFINRTSPRQVGPHTFSLVRRSELPRTGREMRRCGRGDNVCARIAQAHRVNFATGEIRRPVVDPGRPGWGTPFGRIGDSYATERRGDTHTRRVRPDAGEYMYFLCAVHPDMQKRVLVTP